MTLEEIKIAIEDRIKELEPIALKECEIRGPIFRILEGGGHISLRHTPAELEISSLRQMLEPFDLSQKAAEYAALARDLD